MNDTGVFDTLQYPSYDMRLDSSASESIDYMNPNTASLHSTLDHLSLTDSSPTCTDRNDDNSNENNNGCSENDSASMHKLFVGQIPPSTSEAMLREAFSPFGQLMDVIILKDRHTGAHRGCGFVCFATREAADAAILSLADRVKLPHAKREMIVRYAGDRPDDQQVKLYVCMLSRRSNEDDVRALFEPYGSLLEVFIIRSRDGNVSKGAAFVKFSKREEALNAMKAIHDKVKDKDAPGLVQVRLAHTREERSAHLQHVLHPQHMQHPATIYSSMQPSPSFARGTLLPDSNSMTFMQAQHPYRTLHQYSNVASGNTGYPSASFVPVNAKFPESTESGAMLYSSNTFVQQGPFISGGILDQVGQSTMLNPDFDYINPYDPMSVPNPMYMPREHRGPNGANLFVHGLPEHLTEGELIQLFQNYGVILSARIQRDMVGRPKGFGFVSFEDIPSAHTAIQALDGAQFGSRRLTVRVKSENRRVNGGFTGNSYN